MANGSARHDVITGISLAIVIVVVNFLLMPADRLPGDPSAWFAEARSIIYEGRLWVDEATGNVGGPGQFFVRNPADGRLYSKYGIASSLAVVPPVALGRMLGASDLQELFLVNCWQAAMTGVFAWLIYVAAGLHCRGRTARVLYALACLYASFTWFYLRAQGTELYQAVYFAAWYIAIVRVVWMGASIWSRWTWLAWICVLLLVQTRPLYALMAPLTFGLLCWRAWSPGDRWVKQCLLAAAVPAMCIAVSVAAVNAAKFGAWQSSGYDQGGDSKIALDRLPAATGFIVDGRFSVLLTFPPVAISLAGAYLAWRTRRGPYLLTISVATLFALVVSLFGFWTGEASEGPRYLLFVLPILALPCVDVFEFVIARRRTAGGMIAGALLACMLLVSTLNWAELIARPTFAWYRVVSGAGRTMDMEAAKYFLGAPRGAVLHDLYRWRAQLEYHPVMLSLERAMTPSQFRDYCRLVRQQTRPDNFYFAKYRLYQR